MKTEAMADLLIIEKALKAASVTVATWEAKKAVIRLRSSIHKQTCSQCGEEAEKVYCANCPQPGGDSR